jgi:glycerophosphoryl diester phosphodiesterase
VIFDARPTLVGHRGFGAGERAGYRENTVESFQAAAASGLPWVELDVQRSADGELVVRHDPVTPAGDLIITRTAAQLAESGILPLDEVLAALPAGLGVDIDVKTIIEDAADPPGRRTAALVAAALARHRDSRPLLVSSFDPSVLVYLREREAVPGDVALGLLTGRGFPARHAIPAAVNLGLDVACLHTSAVLGGSAAGGGAIAGGGSTAAGGSAPGGGSAGGAARPGELTAVAVIQAAREAGLEVLVWVADPAEAVALARAGADAICIDDVPRVLAALRSARD